jgi:arylsulfatase A-like enzyme
MGVVLTLLTLPSMMPTSRAQPPNVLILFTDDQQADTIAALGNHRIHTPNLDRLVRRGLTMERAYMQGAMNGATCIPSRAMLLSGRSLFSLDEKLLDDITWPEAFAKSGYTTFITGKWHNGTRSLERAFQSGKGIFSGGMTNPLQAKLSSMQDGQLGPPELAPQHACAVFADEAIHFLKSHTSGPFFCYVAFDGPHDPHVVPDAFPLHYQPESIELPPNFLPQHPFDNGEMVIRDEKLLDWPRPAAELRSMIADYYRYISYLDAQIGRILDTLESSPHADQTIVVFASDSGVARGQHGLIGKQNLYEHSIRVPLILAGPNIASGARSASLCYLYDVLPTLGARCQVPGPPSSQGVDFQSTLTEPSTPIRNELLFGYRSVQRAWCDSRWKLIRYPQLGRSQLFDLHADPFEQIDLASNPEHSRRLQEIETRLADQLQQSGDSTPWTATPTQPQEWSPPGRSQKDP